MAEGGARLAIRLLQDAALRGEIDPWDVDVIAVIDGFLDQLGQRITASRLAPRGLGGSYEHDLADASEAFLAASVLVSLKAQVLEASTLLAEPTLEDPLESELVGDDPQLWRLSSGVELPRRPERHLRRRPVAPPPLQRPVTLGELIRQLEDIAERLEHQELHHRQRRHRRPYSERAAMEQVAALAHREKLPETTAALSQFLLDWEPAQCWTGFEELVVVWAEAVRGGPLDLDLDADRVGVFWALLFLCHQGTVELDQPGGLFGPLQLRLVLPMASRDSLPLSASAGSAQAPAANPLAA